MKTFISSLSVEQAVALMGLIGTVFGAIVTWSASLWDRTRRAKSETAWEFHRELSSEPMNRARIRGDQILKKYPNTSLADLYNDVSYENASTFDGMYIVMEFFQRLSLAIQFNRIEKQLVPRLFGEVFYWWDIVVYEPQGKDVDWECCKDIRWLRMWLDKNAKPSDRDNWKARSAKARQERLDKHDRTTSQ
jgi:hypothetical protein